MFQTSATVSAYERFTSLLVRAQPSVHAFVLTLLPRRAEAEEVLQAASIVAWKKFHLLADDEGFTRWLCQIARLEVQNHLRKRRRDRLVFSDRLLSTMADEAGRDVDPLAAERDALHDCIGRMNDPDRLLLHQCLEGGAKLNDLAGRTGRSANSLYKWLNRTRAALLRCVERSLRPRRPS